MNVDVAYSRFSCRNSKTFNRGPAENNVANSSRNTVHFLGFRTRIRPRINPLFSVVAPVHIPIPGSFADPIPYYEGGHTIFIVHSSSSDP